MALCTWLYALGSMHLALCAWPMRSALCARLCALGSITWLYALGSMHLALCIWLYARLYALSPTHLALCTRLYALGSVHSALSLGSMRLALCTWLYAFGSMHGSMHLAPLTWLYALGSMHSALCTRLFSLISICTWLYALGSMRLAPCTWRYVLDSAQVTLCKLVREPRAEEPFATLSAKRKTTQVSKAEAAGFAGSPFFLLIAVPSACASQTRQAQACLSKLSWRGRLSLSLCAI